MGKLGYDDTPMLPGQRWRVHDSTRPQPRVVTPGTASTARQPGLPPSDAAILFDGADLSKWKGREGPARWKVYKSGYMQVVPKTGDIETLDHFGDLQLHLEVATPSKVKGESQGRGNSGVFLMGRYEVQVLDGYDNPTYADGQVGAIYGQYPPLVNAARAPGAWQTYDIVFEAPHWEGGVLKKPAHLTVLLNGVLLHNRQPAMGPTGHRSLSSYDPPHAEVGPLKLQDHGDLVRYRNIWIRRLQGYDAA
ncbi:MAG: DUF1080 domain-containing protein [Gemmatimonadota bacterium]